MAISIVGGATGTTTATLPTHQAGDVIIAYAFRDGSTVQPTLPAGWNTLTTQAGTSCCSRVAWRRATGAGTTVGTWTNASRVSFIVLRGAWSEFPIGSDSASAAAVANWTYPADTIRKTDGTSTIVRFAGHRQVNTNLESPPTGYTNLAAASGVDATAENACHTLSGATGNPTADTVVNTGSPSGWTVHTIEVLAEPPAGYVENYITESSNAGNTVSGAIPTGWEVSGTLTITGVGTESGRQYTEYRWQYTNGTGAADFPAINLASGTLTAPADGAGNIFVYPSDVVNFSLALKHVSGTKPAGATIAGATFLANGNYVGETLSTSLSTVDGTIRDYSGSGTCLATSVLCCPSIAAGSIAAAGTIDWTFRLYEPQFEFGTSRGAVFVPTTVGPDYAAASTGVSAALSYTEPMDTVAAAATIANRAQLAYTEPMDTVAMAATIANRAQLAWTEPMDTFAASATIANQVQLAYTEPMDVFAGTVSLGLMVQMAYTEPMDTVSGTVSLGLMAQLAYTEPMDTLAASVTVSNQAQLSYTEPMDTVAVAATVANRVQLAWTEPMDTVAVAATIENRAQLAYTEPMDTLAATVSLAVLANLNYTEPMDTVAATATVRNLVQLAYTETMDVFAASASIVSGISAQFAYTEPMDTVAVTARLGVMVQLAYTEPMDTVAAVATIRDRIQTQLAYTEPMDAFAAAVDLGAIPLVAGLGYTEPMDTVSVSAWQYPWHDVGSPQTSPWLPRTRNGWVWTAKPRPLSFVWSPVSDLDGNGWTSRPGLPTIWE